MRLEVHNFSKKTVHRFDIALALLTPAGKTLGTTEIHVIHTFLPLARAHFSTVFPYTQFGEDTGNVVLAKGQRLRWNARIKEIRYADGSRAGYDD